MVKMTNREKNLAVAQAVDWPCGLIVDLQGERVPLVIESCGLPAHVLEWSPSTDWNHAMQAAALVGLFSHHGAVLACTQIGACRSTETWIVAIGDAETLDVRQFNASTGQDAICQAVLALA